MTQHTLTAWPWLQDMTKVAFSSDNFEAKQLATPPLIELFTEAFVAVCYKTPRQKKHVSSQWIVLTVCWRSHTVNLQDAK